MERRHYVYSYYNIYHELIYIGKSEDVRKRFGSHREPWMYQVCYVGVRQYPTKTDMELSEVYYIAKEKPFYNIEFKNEEPVIQVATTFTDITKEEVYSVREFCQKFRREVYTNNYLAAQPLSTEFAKAKRDFIKKSALTNPKVRALIKKYPKAKALELTPSNIYAALVHTNQTYRYDNCFFSVDYSGYEYDKANNIVIKHLVDSWNGDNAEHYKNKIMFDIEYQSVKDAIWPVINVETADGFSEIKLAKTICSTDGRTVRYEMLSPEAIAKKIQKMGVVV